MPIVTALAVLALVGPRLSAAQTQLQYRWVYVSENLLVDANVTRVQSILQRAHDAGYNGIVLADYKLSVLDLLGSNADHYRTNVGKVVATAKKLHLSLFPCLASVGYADGILAHDPNLAEGLPVKDALFVAHDGAARLQPDPPIAFTNGGFEDSSGDKFSGMGFQDGPGETSFADKAVKHGGAQSLRMERIGPTNCRVMQKHKVHPWRQYHLSAWVKTEVFEDLGNVRAMVLGEDGRALSYNDLGLKRTQDWTQVHVVFNSLQNEQVNVYLGVWGAKGGRLWWDDAALEEVGLLNVLRRDGCPLTVKAEDGTAFVEGQDFEKVTDPRMGNVPWPGSFEVYHEPPAIKLTPNSRIKEGQRLRVSFYHPVLVYGGQVAACLSDPAVTSVIARQARDIHDLLHPDGYFLSHDEIRVANHDAFCANRHLTAGQLLAEEFRQCLASVRKADPTAPVLVWSDMFDPSHNAVDDYYLVSGSLKGSWEGLPKDVVVVNWNSGKRKESMAFFAGRGNKQVLAGYYDGRPDDIKPWLEDAKAVKGVVGVMYTTWADRYDDLEGFARAAWGR